ncbi:hypothetical protein IL306_006695 [Fusarium sp. DS 682]|nr:hypothetical protein IL306_006695 [Fusarium sp. DS 682]
MGKFYKHTIILSPITDPRDIIRTAAVHLDDGSSVAVAKVEGNPAYKAFMRRQNLGAAQKAASYLNRLYSTASYLMGVNTRLWKNPQTVQELDSAAIKPMLQTLKAAVQSYLGNSICFINSSFPKGERHGDYQQNIINEAIYQIGLTKVWDHTYDAGMLAMVGNKLANFSEPEKLILVIDNSYYGFNLRIFYRDDAMFNDIRYDYQLIGDKSQGPDRYHLLRRAIEEITKPPFGSLPITGELPSDIEELVLYGDHISDPEFRKMLELVLDTQLVSRAHKHQPILSPALGLAEATFKQINDPMSRANRKAQFGCCWKSMGKGCPEEW